ncbi:MAG: chemotaxis protein CheB [Acidobacteriota bacterium]
MSASDGLGNCKRRGTIALSSSLEGRDDRLAAVHPQSTLCRDKRSNPKKRMRPRKSSPVWAKRARKTRAVSAANGNVGGRRLKSSGRLHSKPTSTKAGGPPTTESGSFAIVGVGASAGGLEAFTDLLRALPVDTGMAFVLVQHLDPSHESKLCLLLSRATAMPVIEVQDATRVQPDHVYVIPPNRDLGVLQGVLHLMPRLDGHRPHLSVDYFLRSLAKDKDSKSIGVVLSGTGSDGASGLKAIKAQGGVTFAQDSSAKYDGMPRNAIAAGAVDYVLPPSEIAKVLERIARHPYVTRFHSELMDEMQPITGDAFARIFVLLRASAGVDFSSYKPAPIRRRIARRLALHQIENLEDYVRYLQDSPGELQALFQDMLISVTEFFRDPETHEALKTKVFPDLIKGRSLEDPIRIWVPGCSTGEEPYSLAISLLTFLGSTATSPAVQIFATDINEVALEKARAGKYAGSIASQVPAEHFRRFFTKVEDSYQISKRIRDLVVFARHNVAQDPPFSRMDVISCRNLLIYFGAAIQKNIMPIFHYALKPSGFLVLGSSETVGTFADLFALVDRKQKIYSKKSTPSGLGIKLNPITRARAIPAVESGKIPDSGEFSVRTEVDRILLSRYAPAGVVIDDEMEIIEIRGHTGPYLEPAPGEVSFNLPRMARDGLGLELRALIQQAREKEIAVRKQGLRVRADDRFRDLNLEVIPIKSASTEPCFLVLFEDATRHAVDKLRPSTEKGRDRGSKLSTRDLTIAQLQAELTQTRQDLQSVIEEMERSNEELKSANEEILSSNEELQSTNEELETAKEELEATNEELTTANEELQNRNGELIWTNSDLLNLLSSIDIPIVMLGSDLRIRRFTSSAGKVFNMISTDVGRPISDLKPNIHIPDLEELFREAIERIAVSDREVQDAEGRWYSMQVRPYKTAENKIDGAVMVLADIDALKRSRDVTAILETMRGPLVVLDADQRVRSANRAFYKMFRVRPEETEDKLLYDLGNCEWNIPSLRLLLQDVLLRHIQFDDFEVEHDFPEIGHKKLLLNARQIEREDGTPEMILLAIEDVTERGTVR